MSVGPNCAQMIWVDPTCVRYTSRIEFERKAMGIEARTVAHRDAGIQVFNSAGELVAEALETQSGWFVQVPAQPGRRSGIPNFEIRAMTVVSVELLLRTIAQGLGEE